MPPVEPIEVGETGEPAESVVGPDPGDTPGFAVVQLVLLFLLAPVLLFPRPLWIVAAAAMPLLWIVRAIRSGRFLAPSPLNLILLPLLLMVLVSTWATPDLELSLGKLAGTLLGVFTLFSGLVWIRTRARLAFAAAGFAGLGVILAVLGLLITPFGAKFGVLRPVIDLLPDRLPLPVPEGALNPNPMGGSLILFLPLLLVAAWGVLRAPATVWASLRFPRLLRWGSVMLFGGGSLLCLGVLVLTQSRGAWAGFALACAFLFGVRFRWVGRILVTGVVIAALAGGFYLWQGGEEVAENFEVTSSEIGLEARLEIWNRAIYGIQDFAFTGMGMNSFRKVVHLLYPLFLIAPDVDIASAHNQWLQTALDLGIPGLVAYVALWAAVFRLLWLVGRTSAGPWVRLLVLGIAGGLVAQFGYMVADAVPLGAKLGIFWWLAVTLAAAAFRLEGRQQALKWWEPGEVLVMWVLVSLSAIGLVGDYPYVALALAGLGGIYLGWLCTRGISAPVTGT